MKAKEKFNQIKDSYKRDFIKFNGYDIHDIWYENGWVWLKSDPDIPASKHRVKDLERMLETLKSRNKKQ